MILTKYVKGSVEFCARYAKIIVKRRGLKNKIIVKVI